MTRFMLLTGAAALAVASAATAAPQAKNDKSPRAERSERQAKGGQAKAQRGETRVARAAKQDRRAERRMVSADRPGKSVDRQARSDDRKAVRVLRDERRGDMKEARREIRDDRRLAQAERRLDRDLNRVNVGYGINGCPPGLAKKAVACMPPGQAKQRFVGQRLDSVSKIASLRELPLRLRNIYADNDDYYYRYGNNGYVYRVDRDTSLISALLPLFGLGATVGQQFPTAYSNYAMPAGLQAFYPNTANSSYRYANGYVYEVNPLTGMIEDVDPMLGYGYGYGQMMPAAYSAYNVPTQYRPYYADSDDYYYRYAPGSIYRVDAGSGLIDSVAALLMPGGLTVGQPMAMGYDAYNLPMQYRSQYADTPDNWYRYSNGNVYQIDPTTRLVTAIISALT